jgi:pyridoxal phosphate enzyme (YggS family)
MAVSAAAVAERLAEVRGRIDGACRPGQPVRIVAVTKGFGPEAVEAAVAAGLGDVGENYAAELESKHEAAHPAGPCRWHFLGAVQRNKVRHIAPVVDVWQGVDRLAAGQEIARRSSGAPVLVQVNLSRRPQRNGCDPEDAPALVRDLRALDLEVVGLMALGLPDDPEGTRAGYRRVSEMSERLGLPERSMGMTDDLEVAVQEGATMVRVGRALFGPRPAPERLRR